MGIDNGAIHGKHPDGGIVFNQRPQHPFRMPRRHADHLAKLAGLVARYGRRNAKGTAQFFYRAVDRHGFIKDEVV